MSLLKRPRCPFCHEEVLALDAKRACEACMAWHHRECWSEGGLRCASCGVAGEPVPVSPSADLRVHLEPSTEAPSPLQRPACCRDRPCPRHAVLSALLLALDLEALRKVARRAKLRLAEECSPGVAREVLWAVDVELRRVLSSLSRAELVRACPQLGLPVEGSMPALQTAVLARSQLVRLLHALELDDLRELAERLEVKLGEPRRIGAVRRDLLLAPRLDLGAAVGALRRDDLIRVCRRLGCSPSGTKAQLRERLLGSAEVPN